MRLLAMMPAEQGVVNWPASGASASALIDDSMLPLPDSCVDHVLLAHALETAEHPGELWPRSGACCARRTPNRCGAEPLRIRGAPRHHAFRPRPSLFARAIAGSDARDPVFADLLERGASIPRLSERAMLLRFAQAMENVSSKLALPGAGMIVVEATKQLYGLVGVRRARRALEEFARLCQRSRRGRLAQAVA